MKNEEVQEQLKPMRPQTMGSAVAAMVCGILAILWFWVPLLGIALSILGIVFGVKARNAIAASAGTLKGEGMALAGLVCGIVALGISFVGLIILGLIGGGISRLLWYSWSSCPGIY